MIQQYRTEIAQYSETIKIDGNCNAISFINNGTVTVYINKYPLLAGTSLSIDGNAGEIDKTMYNIDFPTVGLVTVVKKIYL